MPFLSTDDAFPDHPEVAGLSDAAFRLHVAGLHYCARLTTDGLVPDDDVPRLVRRYRKTTVPELVDADLWSPVLGGLYLPSYLGIHHNPTAEQVTKRREDASKRKAKWRNQNEGRNA